MIANIFIRWMKTFISILENKQFARIFNIFVAMVAFSVLLFISLSVYFLVYYGPIMMNLAKKDYTIEKTAVASIKSPVPITASIKAIKLNKDLVYSLPIKTTIKIPINQTFSVALERPVSVPIDHVFHLDEKVHITAQIPFDTTVTTSILGIKKTLPAKGVMPLDTIVPLKHDFHLRDTITVKLDEPLLIPIHDTFEIPVDLLLTGTLPIDVANSLLPSGTTIEADVTIEKKMPVTAEFNPFYELKECPQINLKK